MEKQEQQTYAIHQTQKGPIWDTAGGAAFLEASSNTLKEWGFKINEYDQCMANKTINGRQFTVIWHVDDLKISHVDKMVVEDIIGLLNEKFGKESPLNTTRGKVLEYLGMTLDYSTKEK